MGMEYILEAMQHHGLGHLPQPDNFTTCGRGNRGEPGQHPEAQRPANEPNSSAKIEIC